MTTTADGLLALFRRDHTPPPTRDPHGVDHIAPATTLAERRTVLDELASVRAAAESAQARLAAALRDAEANFRSAERLVQVRRQEQAEAWGARWGASTRSDLLVRQTEARLTTGAPPALGEFHAWLLRRLDEARAAVETRPVGGYREPGEAAWVSNVTEVRQVVATIHAALAELPALSLEADPEVIVARLAALLASIPAVGPDGRISIAPPARAGRLMSPAEERELRWRLEEQEQRRWGAGERR